MHSTNRSIDSISNSLASENKYNVKQRWLHDNKEFSGVGKSILGISESNDLTHASTNRTVNPIAYGSDGKAFGVVPKELIDQINNAGDDWSTKSMAIETMYDIVQETSSMKGIVDYAPSFLKYLCKVLNNETNSKILSNLLKIINKVLSIDEVLYKVNHQTTSTYLVKKLADSNIQIRQLVMRSFLYIMKGCKQSTYLNILLPYLGSASWHIREEVLHLILVSFLKGRNDFDYFAIVDAIAKLLDDPKSTVRFTCRETLTTLVLKGDKNRVSEILYQLVERQEYNRLCDRFEAGSWPKFYEDSLMFDFPVHKTEVMSRASSRESHNSGRPGRPRNNIKSDRNKIGDSPLVSKEIVMNKINSNDLRENTSTFADNYKDGTKPSERMKKFNNSQPTMLKSHEGNNSMIEEYNNLYGVNNKNQVNNVNNNRNNQQSKNVSQNLRLLKTKMRLGSANSNDSEPYTNVSRKDIPQNPNNTSDNMYNNSSGKLKNSNNRNSNSLLVSKCINSLK